MEKTTKDIIEELTNTIVLVEKDKFRSLEKDRLDFGFDSLYFRYAEVCDELANYYALYNHTNPIEERKKMNRRKMRFYNTLEQLIHAHDEVKE